MRQSVARGRLDLGDVGDLRGHLARHIRPGPKRICNARPSTAVTTTSVKPASSNFEAMVALPTQRSIQPRVMMAR
jgi:hypothetical protein